MRWGRAAIVVVVAALAASAYAHTPPSSEDLLSVVPSAKSLKHEIRPLDFYKMLDADGRIVGAAFITSLIPPEVSGYRDEIDVLVGIDAKGTITGTKLLGHNETPELIKLIADSGFFKRFIGKRAGDDFKDIEAITGATISSQAIIDDVRTSSAEVAKKIVRSGRLKGGGLMEMRLQPFAGGAATLLLVAAAIAASLMPRRRWIRTATLALSVAVIGVWLNTPIMIGDLVDLRNIVFPPASRIAMMLLLPFAIIAPLLRGNLYCSYLCPFGALQAGAAALGLPKLSPEPRADRAASWLRWVVALAAIYAIAAMGSYVARTIEPFALCFSREPVAPALVQTGVVLAAALFVRRIWCRFMCPTGLVFDLLALLGAKARHAAAEFRRRRDVQQKAA